MENSLTPYEGTEPYVFVSYSHKDSVQVFEIIQVLQSQGLRIWYDKGIEWGSEWPDDIAEHISNCQCVMVFHSQNSKKSRNCTHEIYFAVKNEKDILSIYLEEVQLKPGIEMQLSAFQATYFYQYPIDKLEEFYSELLKSKILQPCFQKNEQNTATFKELLKNSPEIAKKPPVVLLKDIKKKSKKWKIKNNKVEKIVPIIFILDTSGSMYGEPLENLKKALKNMIVDLREYSMIINFGSLIGNRTVSLTYKIAIITFDSEVKILMNYTDIDKINELPNMTAGGGTVFGEALKVAKNMIDDPQITPRSWFNPRIILVTDGLPFDGYQVALNDFINNGWTAKSERYAVGIGESVNEEFLNKFGWHVLTMEDSASLDDAFQSIIKIFQFYF